MKTQLKFNHILTQNKMEEQEKKQKAKPEKAKTAGAVCDDPKCPVHGNLKTRGRKFKGTVIRKFPKRLTIQFERMVYIRKYERYVKARTKVHARLPDCMKDGIEVGDYVQVQECRPLSKIIHFVVIGKVKDKSGVKK